MSATILFLAHQAAKCEAHAAKTNHPGDLLVAARALLALAREATRASEEAAHIAKINAGKEAHAV